MSMVRGRLSYVPAVLLAASAAALVPSPASGAPGNDYVAMGDSYVAGGIPPWDPSAPVVCAQSSVDYPHLVASELGLSLTDRSCGGARTENISGAAQYPTQPPQISGLTDATRVVTISIGGNDNNTFADVIAACTAADAVDPVVSAPCKALYGSKFVDSIRADGPAIGAAIARIHQKAPAASVFVVGYPDVLPQHGGCYPQIPLTPGDVAYTNGIEMELDNVLREQAQQHDAVFVDTFTPSIGHDACQPENTRWVEPWLPGSAAAPVHPNAAGMRGDAAAVEAAIGDSLTR
ncbi:SGNH/GDSL hydrolase family protein [Nocardia sp. NPDC051570]|uniref:SGNH/GDSL hydrolase family protein n=1 Tax=Nocardia sp. NPDC051570 TaxID=3364324 RepID=UPI0037A01836